VRRPGRLLLGRLAFFNVDPGDAHPFLERDETVVPRPDHAEHEDAALLRLRLEDREPLSIGPHLDPDVADPFPVAIRDRPAELSVRPREPRQQNEQGGDRPTCDHRKPSRHGVSSGATAASIRPAVYRPGENPAGAFTRRGL